MLNICGSAPFSEDLLEMNLNEVFAIRIGSLIR